jgi:hypothetical protein
LLLHLFFSPLHFILKVHLQRSPVGDFFVIGASENNNYNYINFPKPNIIIKKGDYCFYVFSKFFHFRFLKIKTVFYKIKYPLQILRILVCDVRDLGRATWTRVRYNPYHLLLWCLVWKLPEWSNNNH